MKIEHPSAQALTAADIEHLNILKQMIENAVSDGILTPYELEKINSAIHADGQATPAELELVQQLICSKMQRGELASIPSHAQNYPT